MSVIKAVCNCKHMDESNTVLAIQDGPLEFVGRWGLLIWIGFLILAVVTGGIWIVIVLLYHISDVVSPKYRCQFCRAEVPTRNMRGDAV